MVFIVRDESGLTRLDASKKVIKANDFWAYRLAADTVADARRRHDEIISRAKAAFLAEQQRGYEEGSEAARLEHSRHMVKLVEDSIGYFARVEGQMVELVMNAMRQIINGYDDRERVLEVVKNCLSLVRRQNQLRLRVHPSNLKLVKSHVSAILKKRPGMGHVDVIGDRQLSTDACAIETEIGTVEASMSGQLEVLREAFSRIFGPQREIIDGPAAANGGARLLADVPKRRTLV
ncbi:MAG: HrpE/YscL family type III secretion apparatus protein [Lacisediminimonas sp.]|nr:HrpE/YscL family type III secretion apparatus protein [Lacisediminimonas sp.]